MSWPSAAPAAERVGYKLGRGAADVLVGVATLPKYGDSTGMKEDVYLILVPISGLRCPRTRLPSSTTAPADVRARHSGRDDPSGGPASAEGRGRRLRLDELRPRLSQYRVLPQRRPFHRRRPRHPAVSRLSDRGAGGAQHLPRDRLPAAVRGAAHAGGAGQG